MTISTAITSAAATRPSMWAGWLVFTAALILFTAARPIHAAPEDALTDGDKTCLGCHGSEGMSKDLGAGKTLSLHVAGGAYARSVHHVLGCNACHSDIKLDKHPQTTRTIKSARAYSTEMVAVCRGCHDEIAKVNDNSIHAALIKAGVEQAPVCTDCHSAHAVMPKTAYTTCIKCHDGALSAHQKWLPNSALHFEVVSCAACHVPAAKRMIDLRLYDHATKTWVVDSANPPAFPGMAKAADKTGDGLDAAELQALVTQVNADKTVPPKTLRGRIELRAGAETHQFADKSQALNNCAICHQYGAEPFQRVTVSITDESGKALRYDVQPDALNSVFSILSLREVYIIGATRNVLLDALFVLALLGGLAVPVGHQLMKRVVLRMEAAKAKNEAATDTQRDNNDDSRTGGTH